jgi:thioredoxin reductase (NADPH)
MSDDNPYDVIIVGAAASGLTAAIYATRQGMKTLVIGKDLGGQALLTNDIQNYPGVSDADGLSLISKFEEQAKRFGAEIRYEEAQRIIDHNGVFTVTTPTQQFRSHAIILAFGKTPRDLGAPGEAEYKGKGLTYCATCDGPLYKSRTVAVVGTAEYAADAALMLSDLAAKVYLIFNRDRPAVDDEVLANLDSRKNIILVPNSKVKEVKGGLTVESIRVFSEKHGVETEYDVEGVFVELGYIAMTGFVKDLVKLNGRREIIIDKECRTSHLGVFAAGDVTDLPFKQIIISAGQGCVAALSAYNYLQKMRGKALIQGDWKRRKQK